jgi:hypothetical protein
MLVLENKCKKCNRICNTIHFQQKFENWTSGNDNIDKFIQYTQMSAHNDVRGALEWIPYDKFCDIKSTEESNTYKAGWIDGFINKWDSDNWKRIKRVDSIVVNLKSLNDTKDVTLKFMDEV